MASIKEAVIAKEHDPNVEPTIFYMDIRAYGKDFDAYYERAKSSGGVRFIRIHVCRVVEDPRTNNLEITYLDESRSSRRKPSRWLCLRLGSRRRKNPEK